MLFYNLYYFHLPETLWTVLGEDLVEVGIEE